MEAFKALTAQFYTDGFVSAGDPLLVVQSREPASYQANETMWHSVAEPLGTFSLGYLKGMARATSLLAMLHCLHKRGVDIAAELSLRPLHESGRVVYVLHTAQGTKMDEALQSMKISARGSIRKKTNIVQTVVMVRKLYQHGLTDFTVFVRRWNAMAASTDQIKGRKAAALKLLFEDPEALQLILAHVSKMGWDNACWSEENLSSKKIYPHFQFPAKSKKWLARLKTTEFSRMMMVKRAQGKHEALLPHMRKKPELACMEALAERAAAVFHIGLEVQQQVPISDAILEKEWYGQWANGSDHVDSEIQVHLLEKAESFNPVQHCPSLQRLIEGHLLEHAPVTHTAIHKDALEVDEFNLLMKQLKYDVSVFETWQKKNKNIYSAREFAVQERRLLRRTKSLESAELFLKRCSRILVWDQARPEHAVGELMTFRRDDIAAKLGVDPSSIPIFAFLNWSAP